MLNRARKQAKQIAVLLAIRQSRLQQGAAKRLAAIGTERRADIRVPGRELSTLRRVALALRGGGVGYYPRPDFVHVDVGRVRYW
jgi:uncharacterized protein YcbK (DUF882 family)